MAHNQDWLEWLLSLNANAVEYVIVGGVTWAEVNAHCETGCYGDAATKYISRADLIRNKRAEWLEYKTQVFVFHEGDHYRNRLTHTLEGSQIARTIARALLLNEDLSEAVILAHDLGHTPFGHAGERGVGLAALPAPEHAERHATMVAITARTLLLDLRRPKRTAELAAVIKSLIKQGKVVDLDLSDDGTQATGWVVCRSCSAASSADASPPPQPASANATATTLMIVITPHQSRPYSRDSSMGDSRAVRQSPHESNSSW